MAGRGALEGAEAVSGLSDHARRNREFWDRQSDAYQERMVAVVRPQMLDAVLVGKFVIAEWLDRVSTVLAFTVWRVRGPAKDLELTTGYARVG